MNKEDTEQKGTGIGGQRLIAPSPSEDGRYSCNNRDSCDDCDNCDDCDRHVFFMVGRACTVGIVVMVAIVVMVVINMMFTIAAIYSWMIPTYCLSD